MPLLFVICVLLLGAAGYFAGVHKLKSSLKPAGEGARPNSLPFFHGAYAAFWAAMPLLICGAVWTFTQDALVEAEIRAQVPKAQMQTYPGGEDFFMAQVARFASGAETFAPGPLVQQAGAVYEKFALYYARIGVVLLAAVAAVGLLVGVDPIRPEFRVRTLLERYVRILLFACAAISVLVTLAILLSVLFEALRFFTTVPVWRFMFGLEWSPQMAIRADQAGSSGAFGAVPVFLGTILITLIAMLVAIPLGLYSAIYLAEYAKPGTRNIMKPLLEILAGIPTVVYGYFAITTLSPLLREAGASIGLSIASESALVAGVVMGIMIVPFISSLSDDIITAVPRSLREASLGLGATRSETIKKVVLPAALPGIMGAVLLAVSRAIGETMIVVMAAGLAANLTVNPLESVTTVTAQIVSLLVGDQEFDSPKTLAAFALGFTLFMVTLALNIVAIVIVRKYREKYD